MALISCIPKPGNIEITTVPSGARVFLDGTTAGMSPYTIEVKPGHYKIAVEKEGYKRETVTIKVKSGANVSHQFMLRAETGSYKLTTRPEGADIYIDGEHAGKSPFFTDEIEIGLHTITIELDGYQSRTTSILTKKGKEIVQDISLLSLNIKWVYTSKSLEGLDPVISGNSICFVNPEFAIIALDPETGNKKWTHKYRAPAGKSFYPEYLSGGDSVLLYHIAIENPEVVGIDHYEIHALDNATGKKKWGIDVGGMSRVHDGVLYYEKPGGNIHSVDIRTGNRKWTCTTSRHPDWDYMVNLSDMIIDALNGIILLKDTYNNVKAVDINTGFTRWTYRGDGDFVLFSDSGSRTVYYAAEDSYIYAVDTHSGLEKWRYRTGVAVKDYEPSGFTPIVYDGIAYFLSLDKHCYAIDNQTGEPVWRLDSGWNWYEQCSPAASDGMVYFGGYEYGKAFLCAVDAKTGEEIWKYMYKGREHSIRELRLYKDTIYFNDIDYNTHFINTGTGEARWIFIPKERNRLYSVITDGKLYYADSNNSIYRIDITTGIETGKFTIEGNVSNSPFVHEGIMYCFSDIGYLYAFPLEE